jgi:O-antigen/teichoic acid export membrane protein
VSAASAGRAARIYLLSNVLGAGLLFALSALIARAAGAGGLGLYAAVNAWVLPLALLADGGLSTLVVREMAAQPARRPALMAHALALRLFISVPLMLLLAWAAPQLAADAPLADGLRMSAPMLLFLPLASLYNAAFRAHGRAWPVLALNVGMLAAQLALTVAAFAAGAGVGAAIALNVATSGGQALAGWALYRLTFRGALSAAPPLTPGGLWSMLRAAAPFLMAGVLGALQLRLAVMMLEARSTLGAVGLFSAASRPVEAARMAPNALFGALLPALSAGPGAANTDMRRAHWQLLALGIALCAGAAAFGEAVLALVFGEAFRAAAPTLLLLCIGMAFSMQRGLLLLACYARHEEAFANTTLALGLLAQGVLSLLLIPAWGAAGAAASAAASEAVGLALIWRRGRAVR